MFPYFYTHSTLHKENVISLGDSWKPLDNCEFGIFLGSEICYFSWNVFLLERPLKKLFLAERSEVHILTCLCTQTKGEKDLKFSSSYVSVYDKVLLKQINYAIPWMWLFLVEFMNTIDASNNDDV